jgi:hypothetical protein
MAHLTLHFLLTAAAKDRFCTVDIVSTAGRNKISLPVPPHAHVHYGAHRLGYFVAKTYCDVFKLVID